MKSLALMALALAVLGCSAERPLRIVVISIDALRADALGCYGQPRATSPAIDGLASTGTLFEQAVSVASWTLPAHASMLTGTTPVRHRAIDARSPISGEVALLSERARQAGWWTGAVVNAPFLDARYGFARGFDEFSRVPREGGPADLELQTFRLLDMLPPDRPALLFLHTMQVHSPYLPPPETDIFQRPELGPVAIDARRVGKLRQALEEGEVTLSEADVAHLEASYHGEVLATDRFLARVVARLDADHGERLVILLTSDHGEEFLDHGRLQHNDSLFEELIRVPLIVRGGGFPAGKRVGRLVSTVDVAPTVLTLMDLATDGLDGRPLQEAMNGRPAGRVVPLIGGYPWQRPRWVGVRGEGWKLIENRETGERRYFDLRADPGERDPLAPPPSALEMLAELFPAADPLAPDAGSPEHSPEDEAELRALGYL